MGKYDHYNGTPSNDAIPTMLVIIANELAEANRLKRIELNFNGLLSHLKQAELNYIFNGQLDDKA